MLIMMEFDAERFECLGLWSGRRSSRNCGYQTSRLGSIWAIRLLLSNFGLANMTGLCAAPAHSSEAFISY